MAADILMFIKRFQMAKWTFSGPTLFFEIYLLSSIECRYDISYVWIYNLLASICICIVF